MKYQIVIAGIGGQGAVFLVKVLSIASAIKNQKCLGTENFKRIRIGISKPEGDTIDYVLGKFSKHDLNNLYYVFNTINRIIEDFVVLPFEKLMSKYNG